MPHTRVPPNTRRHDKLPLAAERHLEAKPKDPSQKRQRGDSWRKNLDFVAVSAWMFRRYAPQHDDVESVH